MGGMYLLSKEKRYKKLKFSKLIATKKVKKNREVNSVSLYHVSICFRFKILTILENLLKQSQHLSFKIYINIIKKNEMIFGISSFPQ